MGERSLELADSHGECFFQRHVYPCLLQDGPAAGGGVDGKVEGDFTPGLSGEAEYGVGY